MKNIIVPEGMLEAAAEAWNASPHREFGNEEVAQITVEAALRWLSENPIVPTTVVIRDMVEAQKVGAHRSDLYVHYVCAEWQRRMFLAPEPEVPEEVKDLLSICENDTELGYASDHSDLVIEAFHRGQRLRGEA